MTFNKGFLSHLLPIAIFFVLISIYFGPLYTGKVLIQSDNVQLTGSMKEIADYREKGEMIHWNSREFSGLPFLASSRYNPFGFVNRLLFGDHIPKAIMMVFALFIGFYILTQVLGVSRWLAAISSLAFAFSTFNFISIEVGHDNKVLAMAFMAPVLAGVISAYKGKYFEGGLLCFIAAGFQLYFGHIQITYYLLIIVLAYLILVLVKTYQEKSWKQLMTATSVLAVATLLAIGCNFGKLYSTYEYSAYSTRGGSELSSDKASKSGLDKEYAMSWSSGVLETFTIVFPYFHGGASGESLDQDSKTATTLRAKGVEQGVINNVTNQVPLYWGDQPFTQGPIYFGILIILLFILSLFLLEGPIKWWGLGLTLLSLFLAMGKNFELFNDFFFYYVPLYNKFRSVTMSVSIGQLVVPLLGVLVLDKLVKKEVNDKIVAKRIIHSIAILGGLGIFFMLFKGSLFDFKGLNDSNYGFPEWLVNAIIADRKSLFTSDIIRGLIFLVLGGGVIWTYLKGWIKRDYALIGFGILILIDLWSVNRRYISSSDFQNSRLANSNVFQPTQADQQILKDKGYYRVFNTTRRLDQDGITSYFHHSVGGYNAIKLQRYQDVIERHLSQGRPTVLNMLNVKYLIVSNEKQLSAQQNPNALGSAWLINSLKMVDGAEAEISQLSELDPADQAVFDQKFNDLFDASATYSQEGSIALKDYHPEKMTYEFNSPDKQLVVFSEIYYAPGWQAYIDGVKTAHGRVDYILRGMEVPAGEHEIVFKYEPVSLRIGNVVIIVSTLLSILFIILFLYLKGTKKDQLADDDRE